MYKQCLSPQDKDQPHFLCSVVNYFCNIFNFLQGEMLREITPMTRRQGSAVTAMCSDQDCNILVTGDQSKSIMTIDIWKGDCSRRPFCFSTMGRNLGESAKF